MHSQRLRHLALVLVPAGVLVAIGGVLYGSTGRDDAYILYWPAHTLATTGEMVNFNGDRVEQSSSLLYVLLLGLVSRITSISVPTMGWFVGLACGVATVVIAQALGRRIEPRAGWIAGAFTGTCAYLAYWTFGGLETPLAAACCLLAVLGAAAIVRGPGSPTRWVLSVGTIGAYAMVRPEASAVLIVLVIALAGVALLGPSAPILRPGGQRVPRRGVARLAVTVIAVVAAVVVFRLVYFGDIAPQPVHAKVSGLKMDDGLAYLQDWLLTPAALVLPVVAAGALLQRTRRSLLEAVAWLMAGCQLGFVFTSGGDWMEAGRLLVPFFALVAVLAAVTVARVERRVLLAGVVVATQLVLAVSVARTDSTGKPIWAEPGDGGDPVAAEALPFYDRWNRVHLRDGVFMGHVIDVVQQVHDATGKRVTVSSGQAGMVPYNLFEQVGSGAEFIDRGGLSTDSFVHCEDGVVDLPRGAGSTISYGYWFSHAAECELAPPDVIYELGTFEGYRKLAADYVLVYQEPPKKLIADSALLPGGKVGAAQFVAVRADLAPLLSG